MPQKRKSEKRKPPTYKPLLPDKFYRLYDGPQYFGYSYTQLDLRIKKGEIPTPISLSANGRARGWFGRSIIAWQAEREAAAQRSVAA